MKNNIFLIAFLWGIAITSGACSDYLDETPNKSGSAYIYHIDQLYGLMGSLDLYLFSNPSPSNVQYGGVGGYMNEQVLLSDAVEYDPKFWVLGGGGSPVDYNMYCWGTDKLKNQYAMALTWTPCWERIYRFNTVLENLGKVIQTTANIRNQVEGEARFGRAYYHFILLTQYCLWPDEAPGIGYRETTLAGEVPARQTVGYTLGRIYEDLRLAEDALRKAGRTAFDFKHNSRPTVPTVQAFRARVDLYRGNYKSALANATDALKAHNTLVDFKNDPLYTLSPTGDIFLLDETDSHVKETITMKRMMTLYSRRAEMVASYEELYLPGMASVAPSTPISEKFYNLFDRDNDARWVYFYNAYLPLQYTSLLQPVQLEGEASPRPDCLKYADQQWLKRANCHSYLRFYCNGPGVILGMTTAEMYLTQAECLARSGQAGDAAGILKTFRRTRFMSDAAAENIGSDVLQEILDERTREMGAFWRFYEIKRLNGAENAGISIRRKILTNPADLNTVATLEIAPGDPRWALPFYPLEAERMGWEQNKGWD